MTKHDPKRAEAYALAYKFGLETCLQIVASNGGESMNDWIVLQEGIKHKTGKNGAQIFEFRGRQWQALFERSSWEDPNMKKIFSKWKMWFRKRQVLDGTWTVECRLRHRVDAEAEEILARVADKYTRI